MADENTHHAPARPKIPLRTLVAILLLTTLFSSSAFPRPNASPLALRSSLTSFALSPGAPPLYALTLDTPSKDLDPDLCRHDEKGSGPRFECRHDTGGIPFSSPSGPSIDTPIPDSPLSSFGGTAFFPGQFPGSGDPTFSRERPPRSDIPSA